MKLWRPFFQVPLPRSLPDPTNPALAAAVNEYAIVLRDFYDNRAIWHRRLYRATGIIVILVGAALPLLAALDYPGKQLTLSVSGCLVAVMTALRGFYRSDQAWILLRTTEMAITAAYWQWRAELTDDDVENKATIAFLERLAELRQREADSFFKDMSFPSGDQVAQRRDAQP